MENHIVLKKEVKKLPKCKICNENKTIGKMDETGIRRVFECSDCQDARISFRAIQDAQTGQAVGYY